MVNRKDFFKQLNDLLLKDPDKDAILCSHEIFNLYFKGNVKIDTSGYNYVTLADRKIVIWNSVYLPFMQNKNKIDALFISMKHLLTLYDTTLKPMDPQGKFKDELSKLSDLYEEFPTQKLEDTGLRLVRPETPDVTES